MTRPVNLIMWPDLGRGLVVMMNGVNSGLFDEIMRSYAEEYGLGMSPRIERQMTPLSATQLNEYAGQYLRATGQDTIRLDVRVSGENRLAIYNSFTKRAISIAPVGGDAFVGLEGGGTWTFQRTSGPGSAIRAVATGPNAGLFLRR